jgi:dTDP-4-dehydrorhamnose reductase
MAPARAEVDICDHYQVVQTLKSARPDVVINTAAFHRLEACEQDPDRAFAVNCHAVRNLAMACEEIGARLVQLSTDYVFGGDQHRPYPETAPLNPLNAYGVSKAAGEYFVRSLCRRHLVIRTSGLFGVVGSSGKGGNFVETMLRLSAEKGSVSVVTDQVLSPTYTADLASMIRRLAEADAQGVFHVTNSDSCSWYELAQRIFELSDLEVDLRPIRTSDTARSVARPAYSVLENRRLVHEGFGLLRPWRKALGSYLEARTRRLAAVV